MMCARILLDTQNQGYIRTAFSILNTVGQTRSQIRETQAVAATAQNILVETAGLSRENVRFVPFYTKAHLKKLLDNYFEKISIYEEVCFFLNTIRLKGSNLISTDINSIFNL